tara:strand:+ start:3490 stop:3948 length:459 start_codon:yes stop_codon:yes gene_type:complete
MVETKLKEPLFKFCISFINARVSRIKISLEDVRISLESEDKSSAGDKHETGRAMLQLEQEKLMQQLTEANKMLGTLDQVNPRRANSIIALGALVTTSKANYYLAISAGEYKDMDEKVYCISPSTPIGQLLLGKTVGEEVVFNGEKIAILGIL